MKRARVGTVAIPVKVRDARAPSEIFVEVRSQGARMAVSLKITVRHHVPVCSEFKLLAHPDELEIHPTDREIERYGGVEGITLAENIFAADSAAVIDILKMRQAGDLDIEPRSPGALAAKHRQN